MTTNQVKGEGAGTLRAKYRPLSGFWRWTTIVFTITVILLSVNHTFDLRFFVHYMMYDYTYYYLLFAFLLPVVFLHVPFKRRIVAEQSQGSFWVDIAIFLMLLGCGLFFAWHGYEIDLKGWSRLAPLPAVIMAVIAWFALMEAVRRTAGTVLAVVVLVGSFYPIFAKYMPGVLEGVSFPFLQIGQFHIFSNDSAMGILVRIYGSIVIGFTLFGIAVIATGGGRFFINLALSLFGATRGGTAKVAVIASALFASVSGGSIVNVITTGTVTIPAMKKAGFPDYYAGAIETCASTAGTFTPPIMGATAFIMASFIGVDYSVVVLGAAVPALMFYIALYLQIDGYAAKHGLQGLTKDERPPFWKTLKEGWFYIPSIAALILYLFVFRRVADAAFVGSAAMIFLAQFSKKTRFTWASFLQFVEDLGRTLMELFIVLAAVGMLMGSFSLTGLAVTFSRELLITAAGHVPLILVFCALASLIMGMGMPITACYVFLSIVIAPALVLAGLNEMAVHLFVLYYAMLSFLTPPVALCAFPAAIIAGTSPMRVATTAVRLGVILFLLPFFFVLDPSLILHGRVIDIILAFLTTLAGVFLMASSLEGYMPGIGKLASARDSGTSRGSYWWYSTILRAVLIITGATLGFPWRQTKLLALIIAVAVLVPSFITVMRRRRGISYPTRSLTTG